MNRTRVAVLIGLIILVVAGAVMFWPDETSTPVPQEATAEVEEGHDESLVEMDAAGIKAAGIATEAIQAGGLGAEVIAQGMVTAAPDGEAVLTARADGAITRVVKRLGDYVRAGEPIAFLESRDASDIAAERSAAAARAAVARSAYAREKKLFDERVTARQDLELAQAELAGAEAELRRTQSAATAAKITGDGRYLAVSSLISGRITNANATLGSYVTAGTELYRVANPSKVQIEAAVGSVEVQRLAIGDEATVELPDGQTIQSRVRAITPGLGGETRSATAVLDVRGSLQPGLPVRVRLMPRRGETSDAIVVPEESLQTLEGNDVIFVRTPDGFRARNVTIGRRSAGRVEIVKGLKSGEKIATTNAFLLKAELGKGEGGEH